MSSLAAANKHLQRKVDAAEANSTEMKVRVSAVLIVVYRVDYHQNLCALSYTHTLFCGKGVGALIEQSRSSLNVW